MPEYIYLIRPSRSGFFQQSTPDEERTMAEHFEYLKKATIQGTVILAGPCLDETFGLVIIQAEDETAARAFMLDDPSVKANVMRSELHPMHVSLRGK